MKEACFCADCMNDMLVGSAFRMMPAEDGYNFVTSYDLEEDELDRCFDLVNSTISAGFDIGGNRWINGYDAYEDLDAAIFNRAGIFMDEKDAYKDILIDLLIVARNSFIEGLISAERG